MSQHKKPISDKTINQQELKSIHIDLENEMIEVVIKTFLETPDTPTAGQTAITNVTEQRKSLKFSDVPNINGVISSIDNKT